MNLQETVQEKHLLKHPFYQLWLNGKLPKESLQKYAAQYYHLVNNLPKFLSTLHTNCQDPTTSKQLVVNLMEEELGHGNGNEPHTDLWIDFAEELGVNRKEVTDANLLQQTKIAVDTIMNLCQKSTAEGAAALYAYESQVPEISAEKINGLKEFYGIESERALKFFKVHMEADKKHRAVWQALTNKHTEDNKLTEKAALETSTALWRMFDAMHDSFVPEELKLC